MALSSVDAISPAFTHARRQLFKPFRIGFWARIAAIVMTTGDFYGSCTTSGGNYNFNIPNRRPRGMGGFLSPDFPHWRQFFPYLPYIALALCVVLVLFIFWVYAASVFRFIFFDAVLSDRCLIKAGWERWKPQGLSYFLWNIGFFVATIIVFGVAIGGPIFAFVATRPFRGGGEHLALLILGIFALTLLLIALVVLGAVIAVLARDFVVPVMALENCGVIAGWRRFMPMLKAEKWAYAGYLLMKLVLVVGSAIIFGILGFLAFIVAAIPMGMVAYGLVLLWKAAGLSWTLYTVSAATLIGFAALLMIFYVFAFISEPAAVFFLAYAIHFFAARYPLLQQRLSPAPAAPSPAAAS